MNFVFRSINLLALAYVTSQQTVPFQDSSPHRMQFVSVDGNVDLEVLDWGGSGRPIVFLAGYNTAHVYDEIAPKLSNIAHVYGITRRGVGASSRPTRGYSANQSAEDVLRVLDALKLEKPILIGHSFGGIDLSVLGATYPDRMAGLVYLDSSEDTSLGPLIASGWPSDRFRSVFPEALRAEKRPNMRSFDSYREWQRKTLGMAFPEADLRQLFASNPDGSLGRYLLSEVKDALSRDAMATGLRGPDYARIRVQVLAFFAIPAKLQDQINRYKPKTPEEGAALGLQYGEMLAWVARNRDALKRGIPSVQIVEIAGARTYIWLTNEPEVLRELRAFLTKFPR